MSKTPQRINDHQAEFCDRTRDQALREASVGMTKAHTPASLAASGGDIRPRRAEGLAPRIQGKIEIAPRSGPRSGGPKV